MNKTKISKFLSLVLRHQPEKIGIELDEQGWIAVEVLLNQMKLHGQEIDIEVLKDVVTTNDKKRFAFSDDMQFIRANQGHSISINLDYKAVEPPMFLYHGTVAKFIENIREKGLLKMSRHHVHLSESIETASKVGARRGKPIILTIKSGDMYKDGFNFYKSDNNVWLTDVVPPKFIEFKK